MADYITPIIICSILFIGMPWVILHYITQWKKTGSITREDENLLEELYETARRLDDRVHSIERIVTADNPNWKSGDLPPPAPRIEKTH